MHMFTSKMNESGTKWKRFYGPAGRKELHTGHAMGHVKQTGQR